MPESLPEPTINLFLKSGVLFVPSQICQPLGILAIDPAQIIMVPDGTPLLLPWEGSVQYLIQGKRAILRGRNE